MIEVSILYHFYYTLVKKVELVNNKFEAQLKDIIH